MSKAVHFTSFWYRGWGELGNGLFAWVDMTPYFRNSRENGYKQWMQWFFGSFDVWSMVFKATINRSYATLVHPKRSQKSLRRKLVPISLKSFWSGEYNLGQSKQMQRTNRQQKKSSRCQKETRSRATCYQYLRIYLSHPSTLTAWGDCFFLYQMNGTFYDQNREKKP